MIRIAVCAIIAAGIVSAQAPPPPPSVSGVVINSKNGEGVRKTTVILAAKDQDKGVSYVAESDGNGRFRFEDVQPGDYFVRADRPGYSLDSEGAPGAPPLSVKVEAGQSVKEVQIRLEPLGVITGRVFDQDGDPARGAMVFAMRYGYAAGKKQLQSGEQVSANDKGEFRLFDLHPGTIYLRAIPRDSGSNWGSFSTNGVAGSFFRMGNSATFFPSASDVAHATPIELTAGAQLHGFDIRLRQEGHYSVRGKLPAQMRSTNGEGPAVNYMLQIVPRNAITEGISTSLEMNNETFEFKDVPPGSYTVVCMQVEGEKRMHAWQPVDVINSDVEGVTLTLAPAMDLSGVVRVEGTPGRPLENLHVRLQTESGVMMGGTDAEVKQDGTFVIQDVAPAEYEVVVGRHPGAYVKSIRFGDEEAPDGHIDVTKASGSLTIVLGTDVGEVEGSVKKANGDPAVRVRVTLIAYGKHLGRGDLSRSGFTDEQAKFLLKNVAPGDYEIFAWEDVQVGAPQDPEFRKPFEKQAVAVKMAPNGHETVELTAISVQAVRRADR